MQNISNISTLQGPIPKIFNNDFSLSAWVRLKNFFIDKNKYKKYYEIIVDDVPINTVYKKVK